MKQQNRNSGISILNGILGEIKLDPGLVKENNEVLRDFLDTFVPEMEEVDEIFKCLYRYSYYTGSFYSDLRIYSPDEYDINFVLDMPFEDHEFRITFQQESNFVTYRAIPPLQESFYLFENGFLIPENVRNWFQSVVHKALNSYRPPETIQNVYVRETGPARTITIVKNDGETIDVDLVPVIGCMSLNMSRVKMDKRVKTIVGRNLEAFLIPKSPPSPYDRSNIGHYFDRTEVRRLWRCHFPQSERYIIYQKGCAKSVIRLLKLLRDEEEWSVLASYYLKTVVMWMIVENSGTQDFWKENKIVDRFLQALKKLAKYVERRKIPYIFNRNCNLIEKISDQEAYDISNRLNYFIRKINQDINNLERIF
ncbi:cyclic GMP-AMP synthase-like receptor isoform X1 [Parasteatoda tepidariorum]|uniref:cyclic GMP-AMP synthase-like receptor isoform X1 n=1 Tax=Parasteatoda tepidariorum TaxID=114398 RepID=UPI001C71C42C|nr:cyclic GMP-AMP synthase isoform X1 [Parasteatoda tepidariorum]